MADAVEEARALKSKAMDARDAGRFELAVKHLESAEGILRGTLAALTGDRDPADRPGLLEQAVVNQLIHVLGSKGGVFRRSKDYERSVQAYDAGYEFEKLGSGYGIVNSYNLVQRLVARTFAEPGALCDEGAVVDGLALRGSLRAAKDEVLRQLNGKRSGDEYAAADLVLVSLLLGDPDWEDALAAFIDARPEPYAARVTGEVLDELREVVRSSPSAPPGLEDRLSAASGALSPASGA